MAGKNRSLCDASMEPRPFERGNKATSREEWEQQQLQWSHVLSNVETYLRSVRASSPSGASMEPRPFERGNS